jgi:hypothetical protein
MVRWGLNVSLPYSFYGGFFMPKRKSGYTFGFGFFKPVRRRKRRGIYSSGSSKKLAPLYKGPSREQINSSFARIGQNLKLDFGGNQSGNSPSSFRAKSTSLPKGKRKDIFGRSPGSSVPLTAAQRTVKKEGFEDVFGKSPRKRKDTSVRLAVIWKNKPRKSKK